MKKKLLPAGLAAGLLIAALVVGTAMASGGEPGEGGAREEITVKDVDSTADSIANQDLDLTVPDELSVRVAELLGTDAQATHDAMIESDAAAEPRESKEVDQDAESISVHAHGPSYLEYGNSVGAILGLDGRRVAEAIAQAYEELYAIERGIDEHASGWDSEADPAEGDEK